MSHKKNILIDIYYTLIIILFIIFLPLIIPLGLLYYIWNRIYGFWLKLLVKRCWYPKGKRLLFVYSNSPNWKEYIENNILNFISKKAVVINWSERSEWNWKYKKLELKIFKHWTGLYRYFQKGKKKWYGRDFNPIAIIFIPWRKVTVIRFWQAFKDFKHGKDKKLKDLEKQLFSILEINTPGK